MLFLGEGDYVSTAISISPIPTSKYVLGDGQPQNLTFPTKNNQSGQGLTAPFHERRACKDLDDTSPRFFSYLDEHELTNSLEPCFRIWLQSYSSLLPGSSDICTSSSSVDAPSPSCKEEQQGGGGSCCGKQYGSPSMVPLKTIQYIESRLPNIIIDNNSFDMELPHMCSFEQEMINEFLKST